MMGMPDHQFHALIAHDHVESLRETMLASRRRRRLRDDREQKEAGRVSPRLDPLHARAALTRRPA